MALSSPSNQVCSSYLSDKNHGRSKAQMCLKKIIDFISTNGSLKNIELESSSQVKLIHKQEEDEMKVLSSYGKRGFEIDLNLRLGTWFELENDNKGFSACSGVGVGEEDNILVNINNCCSSVGFGGGGGDVSTVDKSSEGECDCDPKHVLEQEDEDEEEERVVVMEEETRELSEITNLQVNTSSEIDNKQTEVRQEEEEEEEEQVNEIKAEKQVEVLRKSEGYLDLLVEAARLISGNFEDDEQVEEKEDIIIHEKKKKAMSRNGRLKPQKKEETQIKMKELVGLEAKKVNEEEWMFDCYGDFEDISPIVRSKRGRNQVLPHKYRDSVLEPWKRLTTTTTKQRSSRVKQRTK
ncbi:hypothetical protein FRX31_011987 [Thalictrum thalictroides]|uniref:Uncharacterized protein n=1 Tax=Thalictrum thalictroides TaxID=46969 RepID=A0A7J6WNC6_THATH|nr:hypothetical protein FRX31_011987 [Thalictrum thalictroides]